MDLSHYNHVFNLPKGLLIERKGFVGGKIAPKRSSLKQTIIDFALGLLYWGTFIAIGLLITC